MAKTIEQLAVDACRQWTQIRDMTMSGFAASVPAVSSDALDALTKFDRQMFALGKVAYPAEGERLLGLSE